MAIITPANANAFLDDCVKFALRVQGTSSSGMGIGVAGGAWGAIGALTDLETDALDFGDIDPIAAVAGPLQGLSISAFAIAGSTLAKVLKPLQDHVSKSWITGVSSLDTYLGYYNTISTSKWQALQHPNFRELFAGAGMGAAYPSPWNLYFEVLQGAVYTNGLAKFVVSGAAFTGGQAIDHTAYAGGFPQVKVSGLTGSGVVTVTGTAFDPATRATATGKTWTATVSDNGTVALAPGGASAAPANSLITAVSAVAVAAGITAGTIYVEAARPTGRPTLP